MLRDPVDRAYSNWMHLWMDGLEPRADVVEAVRHEQKRIDNGWAPFWHYQSLGMYGRQVKDLFDHFPREQVLLLRYKQLVDTPDEVLSRVFAFLGVEGQQVESIPSDNSRPFVKDGVRVRAVAPVIRAGATVGQFLPPQVWRSRQQAAGQPAAPRRRHRPSQADARAAHRPARAAPRGHRAARGGHRRVVRAVADLPRGRRPSTRGGGEKAGSSATAD